MKIRKALPEDREEIGEVLRQSYNIDSSEEGAEVFTQEIERHYRFILAVDDSEGKDKVVGLVSWQMHGLPKHQLAELDRIAVVPEFKGKGTAKALFDFMKSEMEKEYLSKGSRLRKIYLLTHASNKRAQRFYEKLGFFKETVLKDHFYQGEDELVYSVFLG
ncbi:GNAT family N-acetyltransferase [Candidatus Woesearchaeota archaeon]|nr:GNAT family N-acetyltransferase [Candidatus Woesearchaeota archaeon]